MLTESNATRITEWIGANLVRRAWSAESIGALSVPTQSRPCRESTMEKPPVTFLSAASATTWARSAVRCAVVIVVARK